MEITYADFNATTPLDERVFAAMDKWFHGPPGNAGSRTHWFGQRARDAVELARREVATVLHAAPEEILFTSGATESNNLAIRGLAAFGEQTGRKHIVSTVIEHSSVLEPLAQMARGGFEVELVHVTPGGYIDPDELASRVRPDTLIVSVMHANNETGVLQPVAEISHLLEGRETFFHTDAAQTFGKEVEDLHRLRCDFISISGHKIYGPQGIGALCVRRTRSEPRALRPLLFGGGQERGLRPGTLPVALIVGLGCAATLAGQEFRQRNAAANLVKQRFLRDIQCIAHEINGDQSRAQPNVLNISFTGVDSEGLMLALRHELAISNGSACTTSSYSPSHVLTAMGLSEDRIAAAVRLSWGSGVSVLPSQSIAREVRRQRLC